jgi:hypothetical protein
MVLSALLAYGQPLVVGATLDYALKNQPIDQTWSARLVQLLGGQEFLRANLWMAAVAVMLVTLGSGALT